METSLLHRIRAQLTTPRQLTTRMASAIATRMSVDDPLRWLDRNNLEHVSEFEVEILLSPLFTPTREERAAIEPAMPDTGVSGAEQATLLQELQGIPCPVEFGGDHAQLPLHPVLLERYLRLLHLEGMIPTAVATELANHLPATDLPMARSLVRLPMWQSGPAQTLLTEVLAPAFTLEMLIFLTEFMRTYHPAGITDLTRRLRNLLAAYRQDDDHPVFNDQLAHYQTAAIAPNQYNEQAKARQLALVHAWLAALTT